MQTKNERSFSLLRKLESFFVSSGWVLIFIIGCYVCYEHGMRKRNKDFVQLEKQYLDLQAEKKRASTSQEDLLLQLNSQNEPAWIELTLMKVLGLVNEGQTKYLFIEK